MSITIRRFSFFIIQVLTKFVRLFRKISFQSSHPHLLFQFLSVCFSGHLPMDPIQDFSRTQLTLDNCIIPNERLRNTPSSKDGCPHDLEVDFRIVGCEYIQTAGVLLRLTQVSMATAQVLFQRFFYSKSLVKYNMLHVAMACLFLAAKIEENCRRVRDIANVFHHLKQKRMGRPVVPMDYMGEEYFKLKASIIKYERFVLKDLGFCVHVKHPHKLIISYLKILELEKNSQLTQKAWNFMNDSLRTNVFVRFPPETIACACIFLSARQLKIGLPQRPPWWTVFDVIFEDVEAISLDILALYHRPRAFLVDLDKRLNVLKEELVKKQIEIKEVKLKKNAVKSTADSSNSTPPTSGNDGKEESGKEKTSPGTTTLTNQPNPITTSSQKDSPRHSLSPNLPPLIANGSRPKKSSLTPIKAAKRQRQDTPPPYLASKKRKSIPSPSHSPIPERNHSRGDGDDKLAKPVISPIRVAASSGESCSDDSASPPHQRENGIPEQYLIDFTKHKSKHHRHHHHHHHHRTSKVSHHEKRHHRHHAQWEEGGRGKRGHDRHSFKVRRTASDRHR